MADAMVRVRALRKSFGRHEVLGGIDLDVEKGSTVAIIGPSGSGKSTLLRCVNHLEAPTSGSVEIDGRSVSPNPGASRRQSERWLNEVRSQVGMVFQRFNLFPHRTALGNVMEGLIVVRRLAEKEARAQAAEMLERVGLGNKLDSHPAKLSGGQQQRVAIARALVMQPKVMLFDEATSALDPELVGEVLKVIQGLAEEGRTMILVTHEMGFARKVANQVIFLHQGQIEESGHPDQVLNTPKSERLQQFLSGNLK
jgi:ABC-type histidine transport system ATPase subunit